MSYPTKIKAVGINETGGVEVIQDLEIPFPEVKPSDLLIKVEWAGINFIDTYLRSGLYPIPQRPLPIAKEVSGVILELPSDQTILESPNFRSRGFKKGGRVALDRLGSLQEYVAIDWNSTVYAVPDGISARVAGAALLQGLTTLAQVTESYEVKKGDAVLIHTVAGGVGLLHAQLAKARGATVIGTTSTVEKAELAKLHGADHVILYKQENTVERVLELTNGEGVNVIYDGVGKATFNDDFKMIKRKGTIVSFGNASGPVDPVNLFKLVEKNVKLLRPTVTNYTVTLEERNYYSAELWRLVSSGILRINIHAEFPFTAEGVRQAHIDLTTGKTTGKLLIKVAD
ncbi:NAD-P-binding protein [Multifurca ochricompacta]|uniref:Probable quinone oxidoreductase n=1 Tax=Multifurca ochricompacta TaxID=376703 RepID=A0AAD4QNG5_9AGAM|nr:NAD-P-binding protein [Multifurca ochricompacta]